MIGVQILTPDDWRLWRELRLAALAEAPAAFGSTLAEWKDADEEQWRARLSGVPFSAILSLDGEAVGMVGATDDDPVELVSMWIAPRGRGQGVGDAAIAQVVRWAGTERLVTLSVMQGNEAAIALYRRNGFIDAGVSPDDPAERLMIRAMSTTQGKWPMNRLPNGVYATWQGVTYPMAGDTPDGTPILQLPSPETPIPEGAQRKQPGSPLILVARPELDAIFSLRTVVVWNDRTYRLGNYAIHADGMIQIGDFGIDNSRVIVEGWTPALERGEFVKTIRPDEVTEIRQVRQELRRDWTTYRNRT